MATIEQENELRGQLKQVLENLAAISAEELARKDLGAGLNFESGVVYFSRALRLFNALNELSLDDVAYQKLLPIRDQANNFLQLFRNVQQFSVVKHPNNPIAVRDQFINQARDWYDPLFEQVSPVVAFAIRRGTDFARLERQAQDVLQRMNSTAQGHEDALKVALKDAQEVVDQVRRIARESGVSQHAIHFKDEADQHEKSARSWLTATVWLGVATLVVTIALGVMYFLLFPTLSTTQSLQLAVSKIIVISVLLSATLWAGRTYRAHRHNAVVNRHRQNALATFEAFAKAASDEPTKNAVLLQATQCIFAPQQTGYIHGEADGVGVPQVLEIIRDIGKSR